VVDGRGAPVEGATVETFSRETGNITYYGLLEGIDPLAITNSAGEFALVATEPGVVVSLKASARGFAPRIFAKLPAGERAHQLALSPGAFVSGRLLHEGRPLAGVRMGLVQKDRSASGFVGQMEIGTDAEGRFLFSNVAPGQQYVVYGIMESLGERGALPVKELSVGADDTTTALGDLLLEPPQRMPGRVVLSDGQPLPAGTRLLISREDAWDSQLLTLPPDGRFEARGLPKEKVSLSISVPKYRLATETAHYEELNHDIQLDLAGLPPGELTILLDPEDKPLARRQGRALMPSGQPAAGAEIAVATKHRPLFLMNGRPGAPSPDTADAEGRFSFPIPPAVYLVVVVHAEGFAQVGGTALAEGGDLTLTPWGKVEGVAYAAGAPAARAKVMLNQYGVHVIDGPYGSYSSEAVTTAEGRFTLDRVHPGAALVGRVLPGGDSQSGMVHMAERVGVYIEPGGAARVELGKAGTLLTGRLRIPPELEGKIDVSNTITSLSKDVPQSYPPESQSPEEDNAWYEKWSATPEGRKNLQQQRHYDFVIGKDGRFQVEAMAPGTYRLTVLFLRPGEQFGRAVARASHNFTIGPKTGARLVLEDLPVQPATAP
jgi:hypothetical protein